MGQLEFVRSTNDWGYPFRSPTPEIDHHIWAIDTDSDIKIIYNVQLVLKGNDIWEARCRGGECRDDAEMRPTGDRNPRPRFCYWETPCKSNPISRGVPFGRKMNDPLFNPSALSKGMVWLSGDFIEWSLWKWWRICQSGARQSRGRSCLTTTAVPLVCIA